MKHFAQGHPINKSGTSVNLPRVQGFSSPYKNALNFPTPKGDFLSLMSLHPAESPLRRPVYPGLLVFTGIFLNTLDLSPKSHLSILLSVPPYFFIFLKFPQ